jgi:flagellar L-ring protein precursor FlgH
MLSPCTLAQSLLRDEPKRPVPGEPADDPQAPLRGTSLTLVEAPPPREYAVHDLITIIVQEQSQQSSSAKLDTKKDSSMTGEITTLPDLVAFLEGRLESTDRSPLVGAEGSANSNFKGDGKYERSERLTDRITAEVLDVKPNGTLVIEARRTIGKDKEVQTMVLSGKCRREDVTNANTILSSQLAELTVRVESEGDVKDTASKGFFTRLFDAIFSF